jgi:protein translocase SecG subunit
MQTFVSFAVIIVVALLVASILMQVKGAGGGLFGGGQAQYRTRRGVEKTLFQITIGLAVVFVVLALVNLLVHLLTAENYGYFRDELYYIAASERLDLGYVDFPPLIALVARLLGVLAGDALWAIHVVPALATALIVLLTGLMARVRDDATLRGQPPASVPQSFEQIADGALPPRAKR